MGCSSSKDHIQPLPCHKSNRGFGAVTTQYFRDSFYVLISASLCPSSGSHPDTESLASLKVLPISGYRQNHICCSPICTEDEADQAPEVCQCTHSTTPGEDFSLFLLPSLAVLPEQGTEMLSTQLWQYPHILSAATKFCCEAVRNSDLVEARGK